MSKSLSFTEFSKVFGRPDVRPDDVLVVNETAYQISSIDAEKITFSEITDDEPADEED